jgi:hypothetical protein
VTTAGPAAAPRGRIDPDRTYVVLIGVDEYTHLAELRSVRHNLTALRAALIDPEIWGIAEDRVRTVENPATGAELTDPIYEAAGKAEDTLIVYYAGHGLIDRRETQLLLTLPGSEEDRPDKCVRAGDVNRAIGSGATVKHHVLLLDCCFSGKVLTEMGGADDLSEMALGTLHDITGSYVMTSAPKDRPSHAPNPKHSTVFTGAFVDVLRQGVPDGPEMLSLHALFQAVKQRIADMKLKVPQEPQDEDRNGVGGLDFARNVAVLPPLTPRPAPEPPPSRLRVLLWTLAAATAGLAVGLGAPGAVDWWHTAHPAAAAGTCGGHPTNAPVPRAVLLDHSDALDKKNVDYEEIEGLSALALTAESERGVEAFALADNDPGLLFPVRLGTPFDLNPVAGTAHTLRRPDGTQFPKDRPDGEGLVVERGGRTVLVASEDVPAIRRFDLATGKQIGADFPVPKALRYWPDGTAQTGRGIESLALSPDGKHLYAGWEAPLAADGDKRGRYRIRIQRYTGTPGGTYEPDGQYGYLAGDGMNLVELVALDNEGGLLALERAYTDGLGSSIRVVQVSLDRARDVQEDDSLYDAPPEFFADGTPVFSLSACPSGGPGAVATPGSKPGNPLVDNVEGMAVGKEWTTGEYQGWRPLYLVSDDNGSGDQITRLYSLALRLKP